MTCWRSPATTGTSPTTCIGESLAGLSPTVQRFLRRTAIVDQLCAPLCEAILEETGAQAHLAGLEATSLFLIPLDRRRGWYRYHALFREFLLGELRRVEPDIIEKLHLRAADWYQSNGSPTLALEHLMTTKERDRCVMLAAGLVLPTFQAGQLMTVQRWLAALGESAVHDYPPLAVLAGWFAVLTGNTAEAHRWASFVETASFDLLPMDSTTSFGSSRAMLAALMCRDGPRQMATDASFAVAQEPPWSPWRAVALILSAESQLLLADRGQASALLTEAAAVAAQLGNVHTSILSHAELAVIAMDHGDWTEAGRHVDIALSTVDAHRLEDFSLSVLAYAASARVAVHRGDLAEAHTQIARAMRARPTCTFALPWLAVRVRLQLAKVYAAIADRSSARHLLLEIDDIMAHRPALGALTEEVSLLRQALASSTHVAPPGGPL